MNDHDLSIDITFPVYNEEKQLKSSIDKTLDFCRQNRILKYTITIADNGSTDQTGSIAKSLEKNYPNVRYLRIEQKGVGIALKTAWSTSSCDIVGAMDLDLSADIAHLLQAYCYFQSNKYNCDLIVGTRLKEGAVVSNRTLLREITSRGFNFLLKRILGVHFTDGMCGFKFLKKDVFEQLMKIGLLNNEWFFETELLVRAEWNGFKITEIPVYWIDDLDTKVELIPTIIKYLKEIIKLRKGNVTGILVKDTENQFDFIILGAGIYGLYAAYTLLKKNLRIAVVECEDEIFGRASYINQARVHNGYHYPRSLSTAISTKNYYQRFIDDFNEAINYNFKKIYAISERNSYASARDFKKFCDYIKIPCKEINPDSIFQKGTVEAAYETLECSFDPMRVKEILYNRIEDKEKFELFLNKHLEQVEEKSNKYCLLFSDGERFISPYVLNATYASVNQVVDKFNFEKFRIKYEICEIALCQVPEFLRDQGITLMDGPFFSLMPFGLTGRHSLSSVEFTPHRTSFHELPTFNCQNLNEKCSPAFLDNCNLCPVKPITAFAYMNQLAKKYLNYSQLSYENSLFAIKPILLASELDDSRPTIIKAHRENPHFTSVLSGKINTIYDLERELI